MGHALTELIERFATNLAYTIKDTRASEEEIRQLLVSGLKSFVLEFLSIVTKQISDELSRAFL